MKSVIRLLACIALALASHSAFAQISYISTSGGYMVHASGSTAVTANWQGQAPIQGFGGYGQITVNGNCLTQHNEGQPLTWEACRNDKSQRWSLSGGKLNNENGWCADVQGNRGGAGVPVIAWKCSGAANQQFKAHRIQSAASVNIADPQIKAKFVQAAQTAAPGTIISTTTGQIVAQGGGNIVAQGGGNIVAQGGGNIVAQGGGN